LPRKKLEEKYYELIKDKLEELFKEKGVKAYFEITAKGTFSNTLKAKIPSGGEIIFLFLKKAVPDITGFVQESKLPGFVVVEVKGNKIELDDIYQLKKYADLFDARFAFLVSIKPIPEEIKRLSGSPLFLLSKLRGGNIYQAFALAHFDEQNGEFVEWFEEDPFIESIYWR
jgi:hypothetical protein